ncbi:hypothetical protein ACFLZZ_02780 [Nanoarchaeota archaeon]
MNKRIRTQLLTDKKFNLSKLELSLLEKASKTFELISTGKLDTDESGMAYDAFGVYQPTLEKVKSIEYFGNILDNYEKELKKRYDIITL